MAWLQQKRKLALREQRYIDIRGEYDAKLITTTRHHHHLHKAQSRELVWIP